MLLRCYCHSLDDATLFFEVDPNNFCFRVKNEMALMYAKLCADLIFVSKATGCKTKWPCLFGLPSRRTSCYYDVNGSAEQWVEGELYRRDGNRDARHQTMQQQHDHALTRKLPGSLAPVNSGFLSSSHFFYFLVLHTYFVPRFRQVWGLSAKTLSSFSSVVSIYFFLVVLFIQCDQ